MALFYTDVLFEMHSVSDIGDILLAFFQNVCVGMNLLLIMPSVVQEEVFQH